MPIRALTTILTSLTLAGLLSASAATAGARAPAGSKPAASSSAVPAPKRPHHRPLVEGCFEPPPEPIAPPPCTDERGRS